MTHVAPFSSVKSVSAHIVLQTMATWGFGSGINWSSAWIGCGVSPGRMLIDDSDEDEGDAAAETPATEAPSE